MPSGSPGMRGGARSKAPLRIKRLPREALADGRALFGSRLARAGARRSLEPRPHPVRLPPEGGASFGRKLFRRFCSRQFLAFVKSRRSVQPRGEVLARTIIEPRTKIRYRRCRAQQRSPTRATARESMDRGMEMKNRRSVAAAVLGALFSLALLAPLRASEGGAGPEAMSMGNMCMVMFGYDMIHITAYQPGKSRSEYCAEIPWCSTSKIRRFATCRWNCALFAIR
ncbi:MAG: hypothetical protein FD172_189 [Methylocystaceae bacterium]|nr:MAG: hypothetical protein FD172_189 [Methylocystaceae bacterium]